MEPNVIAHLAAPGCHFGPPPPRQVPLAKDLALSEVPKESDEVGWNAGSASWEAAMVAMVHGFTEGLTTNNHLDGWY